MAQPQFEMFTHRHSRADKIPILAIQRRFNASANRAAVEALGNPEAVHLLYDGTQRIIGLRAAKASDPHAYPLRKQGEANTYILSLTSFIRHYEIDTQPGDRYTGEMLGDVLCFDLNQDANTESPDDAQRLAV